MPSAGERHTCFLLSNGTIATSGSNANGQCVFPDLPAGMSYVQVSAGGVVTAVLRSDGAAWACGGRCYLTGCPYRQLLNPLAVRYTQVAAGYEHIVLLRDDGQAEVYGDDFEPRMSIPRLEQGMTYTEVAAGQEHTVFLRRDGKAVACGNNDQGQCNIPTLPKGLKYTKIAAGYMQTLLLRSDGRLEACGSILHHNWEYMPRAIELHQQLDDKSVAYTQLSVGSTHIAFLRGDGTAEAIGPAPDRIGRRGHCRIPRLEDDGVTYVEVSAGAGQTVLLRSDGIAVSFGHCPWGNGDIPLTEQGVKFVATSFSPGRYVVQLSVTRSTTGAYQAAATNFAGARLASWVVTDRTHNVHQCVRMFIPQSVLQLSIVGSGGRPIHPHTTWECLDMQDSGESPRVLA